MTPRNLHKYIIILIVLLTSGLRSAAEPIQLSEPPDGSNLALEVIVDKATKELTRPNYITSAGDGSNRLFVLEQQGTIRIIQDGEVLEEPFLDVSWDIPVLEGYTEQGLLGLAFHPDYENNGRFFVNYTKKENDGMMLVEYRVSADDPNIADPDSARLLMFTPKPGQDHNGGQLAFGPDGYLYIGYGDGLGPGDPEQNGQNLNSLLGKILRINVEDDTVPYRLIRDNPYIGQGRPEVWAYGLRNPYSFSFDPVSGDMYIGDVGQDTWEEINFLPGGHTGGANFGWRRMEGNTIYDRETPPKMDMLAPAIAYEHTEERCAVIAGHVYRGGAIPELQGVFIYGDWCASNLFTLYKNENGLWESSLLIPTGDNVTSIGVDEQQEIYITTYSVSDPDLAGGVLKLVPGS